MWCVGIGLLAVAWAIYALRVPYAAAPPPPPVAPPEDGDGLKQLEDAAARERLLSYLRRQTGQVRLMLDLVRDLDPSELCTAEAMEQWSDMKRSMVKEVEFATDYATARQDAEVAEAVRTYAAAVHALTIERRDRIGF